MRLRRIALQGITRFAEPVEIDFAVLGEGLIAIAGPNGAGKTTLLEAPFAALHLELPTRPGSLYASAHGKDAKIELEVENGQPYRALVAIDAVRQTSEAYLFAGDGAPITNGKLREYTAAVEERFGSPRLMLSAALSAQNKRGSFLDLSKADRKELLSEILDTGNLQRLAEAARDRAKAAELALERARGAMAAAEQERARLDNELVDVEALRQEQGAATKELAETRARLEAARETVARLTAELATAEQAARAVERLRQEVEQARLAVAGMQSDRQRTQAAHRDALSRLDQQAEAARADAERLPEYAAAEESLASLRVEIQDAAAEDDALIAELQVATAARRAAELAAAELLPAEERLRVATLQAELLQVASCATSVRWAPLVAGDTEGLPDLRHAGNPVNLVGVCPLVASARAGEKAMAGLEADLTRLAEARGRVVEAAEAVAAATPRRLAATERLRTLRERAETLQQTAAKVHQARAAAERLADLGDRREAELTSHIERLAALQLAETTALARAERLAEELQATQPPDTSALKTAIDGATKQAGSLRGAVDTAEERIRSLDRRIARAEEVMRRHAELTESLAASTAAAAAAAADLGEWRILERALGRDGIQAMLIDAAGPELSALTNDLLHSCFSDRFEVRFVTQLPKADGKSSKEVFDLQVIDHERGREGSVESLSGGEKVIISEAVSLALAIFVGRSSGRRFLTLFRDETSSALDEQNAPRYISMLRKAKEIGGFWQVVFVAHQSSTWSMADAVLWLEDGRVEVR